MVSLLWSMKDPKLAWDVANFHFHHRRQMVHALVEACVWTILTWEMSRPSTRNTSMWFTSPSTIVKCSFSPKTPRLTHSCLRVGRAICSLSVQSLTNLLKQEKLRSIGYLRDSLPRFPPLDADLFLTLSGAISKMTLLPISKSLPLL